eukprot:1144356-Pelagomonas_calceolata.AAC.5
MQHLLRAVCPRSTRHRHLCLTSCHCSLQCRPHYLGQCDSVSVPCVTQALEGVQTICGHASSDATTRTVPAADPALHKHWRSCRCYDKSSPIRHSPLSALSPKKARRPATNPCSPAPETRNMAGVPHRYAGVRDCKLAGAL